MVLLTVVVHDVGAALGLLLLEDEQGDDKAEDAASFAQNDTDQVFRLDARHLHHGAEDGGGSDHDTPIDTQEQINVSMFLDDRHFYALDFLKLRYVDSDADDMAVVVLTKQHRRWRVP